jgi:hypothetical protein
MLLMSIVEFFTNLYIGLFNAVTSTDSSEENIYKSSCFCDYCWLVRVTDTLYKLRSLLSMYAISILLTRDYRNSVSSQTQS